NVGLRAAELFKRSRGDVRLPGHCSGDGEEAVAADVISAKTNGRARKTHCLLVIASDELGEGGDAIIKCGVWIVWAHSQRALGGLDCLLPFTAEGQRKAIDTLGQR